MRQDQLAPGSGRMPVAERLPIGESTAPQVALALLAHAGHVEIGVAEHAGIVSGSDRRPRYTGPPEYPMRLANAHIPYRAYWRTPFCKWQGSLANANAIVLAAEAAKKALGARKIATSSIDTVTLGMTVLQKHQLYGGPWLAALIGAEA